MEQGSGITCRECQHLNSPGSRFCDNCGRRIDGVCPSCGHENEPGARFCNSCGQSLSEDAVQQAAPNTPASGAGVNVCPRCLHRNDSEAQFCYSCGLPLTGERARQATPAIGAFEHGIPGGFWVRVAATIIDVIVLTAFDAGIYLLLGGDLSNYPPRYNERIAFAELLTFVIQFLYAPVLISLWGTTIGKRALNLYVLRADGTRCGFWRALGRTLASILSLLLLGIGYLMVAFRADKRALHDLIAGTAVIQRS